MCLQVKFQGNFVHSTELYNDLNKLNLWHESNITLFKDDQNKLSLFYASQSKIKSYIFENGMPSINLFKSARFLDPNQWKFICNDIETYKQDIPELGDCYEEWLVFKDL